MTAWWRRRPRSEGWGAAMPAESPLLNDISAARRSEVALALMDDSVYGYMVLTINREGDGSYNIALGSDVDPRYWPALSETLARILEVIG